LNTAADAFRQRDNETGRGERDADAAELLKGSWETINEALAELMVLNFDQESLHETIQKLTEIIQTISAASQDTAAKLEETLADLHESGVTR
jgi:vacuolar-type H+-ATPase subunit I/STV1